MKTFVQAGDELGKALDDLKSSIWQERKKLLILYLLVVSFLLGAGIEHYYPKLLSFLW